MPALSDYEAAELEAEFGRWGEKPSHAERLLRAFYLSGGRPDVDALKLSRNLRRRLGEHIPLRQSRVPLRSDAADGTSKLLVVFDNGGAVEAVLMPAHDSRRAAGCVSSQIGCAMGCRFCASTRGGLERNLTSGEIVEQFLHLRELAAFTGRRLSTLVFMGMGEPMHNLDNVIAAIRRIASPGMGELGGRQITVSTVGIVPEIERLAQADLNVHLALSLHAPDDDTRDRLVPMNRKYGVAGIIAAAKRFAMRTGRIVNIEYCLVSGINDSDGHAHALAELLADFRAHVNLIACNPITGASGVESFAAPSRQRMARFLSILCDRGIVAHTRKSRGADVNAACGQLRARAAAGASR